MDIHKRKGIVNISLESLKSYDKQLLKAIFSEVYPIHIERNLPSFTENVKYYCLSEHFEEVKPGDEIPEYELMVQMVAGELIFKGAVKL